VAIVRDVTVNGGATLKRVYVLGDSVRLEPRNPEMHPIVVPGDQAKSRAKLSSCCAICRRVGSDWCSSESERP
jgi:Peptidase S24-like